MKVTNGTNPNNQVPKDTVDNIMKTYENIINQHLKNMEQISESIKELHTTSYNIEKTMKEYIDGKIKDMVEKFGIPTCACGKKMGIDYEEGKEE